jgi:diketogulonate reductase-like aldo/keto reductase
MRCVELPMGVSVPILGQGTWHIGEDATRRPDEVAALRLGLDLGMKLVDTAEAYADGGAEEVVGEAVDGRRDEVFLVTKVLPDNASRSATVAACERSLRRLRTDRIDLYLYHWRGETALEETLAGFEALLRAGKIRGWGVSNFDVLDLEEVLGRARHAGMAACQTDQVLYNLTRRGIEVDLLPFGLANHVPIMAYSPIEQGRLLSHLVLKTIARLHGATPAQVALAWVLRHPALVAVPKMGTVAHVRENVAAAELVLTERELIALDDAFSAPTEKVPLEML